MGPSSGCRADLLAAHTDSMQGGIRQLYSGSGEFVNCMKTKCIQILQCTAFENFKVFHLTGCSTRFYTGCKYFIQWGHTVGRPLSRNVLFSFGSSVYQFGCMVAAVSAQQPVEHFKNALQNITPEWTPPQCIKSCWISL